jgi:hypothetical protein
MEMTQELLLSKAIAKQYQGSSEGLQLVVLWISVQKVAGFWVVILVSGITSVLVCCRKCVGSPQWR